MKRPFIIASCIALTGTLPGLAADSEQLSRGPLAVSASFSGDTVGKASDNSAKKIAIAMPGAPRAAHLAGRNRNPAPYTPVSVSKNSLTLKLPTSVDEAADYCCVTAKHMNKVGTQKALEVSRWFGTFFKQLNAPPTMSPVGSLAPQAPNKLKLWYMPDGRLKTIVER